MDAPNQTAKLPSQIPFIIGNEACERFSFYGMRNILTVFLIEYLLLTEIPVEADRTAAAKATFHIFVAGVYWFPLIGGYLSDRFLGKYRTILYVSLIYCAGHLCLALFDDNKQGFYAGLFLIAVGSGGIKPCVSAMVGDQFDAKNKHLAPKVFAAFYWSINFGSFFASLLIPLTLKKWGPSVAFGIPGALMALATIIFWLGRNHYVHVPPTGANPHSFLKVLLSMLKVSKKVHPEKAVAGAKAALRVLLVFLPIPFFWALFDQKASTWVVQAKSMDPDIFGLVQFQPSQMQFVNPMLVMLLIPFTSGVVYPAFKRWGYELTPLRRMTIGMVVGSLSYVVAGLIQVPISNGEKLSILWQLAPYVLLTTAEVLVSTTGLEFAYSQAPREMKGTLMAFWNLTVTAGNLAVALASAINIFTGVALFFFYAGMALLAAVALGFIARSYKPVDQYGAMPA
jgi:proton-dependent oligopeptide transporter, POT family